MGIAPFSILSATSASVLHICCDLASSRQCRYLFHVTERTTDCQSAGSAQVPAPPEIEVAATERLAVKTMIENEIDGDAHDGGGRQTSVLLEDERSLEVIVKRHHARAVRRKIAGGAGLVEVDQDALDSLAVLENSARSAKRRRWSPCRPGRA